MTKRDSRITKTTPDFCRVNRCPHLLEHPPQSYLECKDCEHLKEQTTSPYYLAKGGHHA